MIILKELLLLVIISFKILFSYFAQSDVILNYKEFVICSLYDMHKELYIGEIMSVWMFGIENCWMGLMKFDMTVKQLEANPNLYF
jgi:hypothetical protein